ncbi:GTPase domain-containing protein [Thalassococcus sp. S3]|uniref:GTPase domain-containing protein n=1 Tax=Thalassococcus sp. S3 TaxID=2017482 RepID=UPI0010247F79|nr:GTPase domain-containing protein [Thalassococcus sp. S3]QBF33317.1 hypothetical protein CFI11_19135 [Thalassococcus sp. S3]
MAIGIAIGIACLMLYQYIRITMVEELPESWNRRLMWYRNNMRFAVIAPIFFLMLGSLTLFFLVNDAFKDDILTETDPKLVLDLNSYIVSSQAPHVMLLVAFFTGVLKLFVERAADDDAKILGNLKKKLVAFVRNGKPSSQTEPKNLKGSARGGAGDAWFFWFLFSVGVVAIQAYFVGDKTGTGIVVEEAPVAAIIPSSSKYTLLTWGIASILTISIGYFCWIYMVLFQKLTEAHHFSADTARLFLGGIARDSLPRQAILIGPPGSGKSTFCQSTSDLDTTIVVESKTHRLNENDGENEAVDVTVLDAPGENMGDHITLCSAFRADTLVFMVDVNWLEPTGLSDSRNYELRTWSELLKQGRDQDEVNLEARKYFQGFYYGSKRDESLVSAGSLYKVRSFLLYLNTGKHGGNPKFADTLQSLDFDSLSRLACEIGDRFGVSERGCSWMVGDALSAMQAVQMLSLSTEKRFDKNAEHLSALGRSGPYPTVTLAEHAKQVDVATENAESASQVDQ